MTILEDEDNYKPLYIRENRGWTDQEAKDFIKEIERLKELWYPDIINAPEVSTREVLANLRNYYKAYLGIERENQERHEENDRRRQEHLRKIKEENKNLEWPKPPGAEPLKIRQPFDYWKDGCLYCSYKPQTTHDYEVHIVTRHLGKPAYPGPADIQKFERERKEKQQKKREEEEEETISQQEEPKSENEQLEQAQTEAKVKSEVSTNVMAHSSSHVQLEPYEPPTGKKALDMWETGFWCNDEMGCCGICQEIGSRTTF